MPCCSILLAVGTMALRALPPMSLTYDGDIVGTLGAAGVNTGPVWRHIMCVTSCACPQCDWEGGERMGGFSSQILLLRVWPQAAPGTRRSMQAAAG